MGRPKIVRPPERFRRSRSQSRVRRDIAVAEDACRAIRGGTTLRWKDRPTGARGRSASGVCSPHTTNPPHAATPTQANRRSIHPQLHQTNPTNPRNTAGRSHQEPSSMATLFCAAAATSCRLAFPLAAPAPAPGLGRGRARRGMVAVRAEADTAAAGSGINPAIRKEEAKVVDTVLAGELSKPLTPYCRYSSPSCYLLLITSSLVLQEAFLVSRVHVAG